MRHLRDAGIEVLCYNFMLVRDWTLADPAWRGPNGTRCMRINFIDLAAFDIHILQRKGAAEDFPEEVRDEAARCFAEMDTAPRE